LVHTNDIAFIHHFNQGALIDECRYKVILEPLLKFKIEKLEALNQLNADKIKDMHMTLIENYQDIQG
jgi:hypothetical protein